MAEKRYFKILPDLTIMELNGKKAMVSNETEEELVCSHEEFIHARTTDSAFAGGDVTADPPKPPNWSMRAIVSAETVRALVRGKKPGDLIEMDEDDWERLKRATEKGDYLPIVAGSLIPFMREICDAKTTKPPPDPEVG